MSSYKQRTLDFLELEWATYIERFNRWPAKDDAERVKKQGYARFQDMLAHILAWWEEAMPIILALAENGEYERKKYDFDVFNAAAVEKYKDWSEKDLFAHYEKTRQKSAADLRSMNEAAWENRRIINWVRGVFIDHAREHLVALSRFLTIDTLENEWSEYIERFEKLENKEAFLKKQGVENFHDILAHVIGWWEEGDHIVTRIMKDPDFKVPSHDTDAFNIDLVEKYKNTSDADLQKLFESKRRSFLKLTKELPEEAFVNKDIEGWLAADVVEHFDEHPLSA